MENLKLENLKLTGWIQESVLKHTIICIEKPKKGKYIQVLIEFTPMLKKKKQGNNG